MNEQMTIPPDVLIDWDTLCECGHSALAHHGQDGRVRRDAGCQTNVMRTDWCQCPKISAQVIAREETTDD